MNGYLISIQSNIYIVFYKHILRLPDYAKRWNCIFENKIALPLFSF